MGNRVETLYDVGVAGIHRLLSERGRLESARVLVVVAGMEGALPSVVGGLVDRPIVAVPTSIGYGVNFKGLSALLAMLNSCAPGITVVNIDSIGGASGDMILAALLDLGVSRDDLQRQLTGLSIGSFEIEASAISDR